MIIIITYNPVFVKDKANPFKVTHSVMHTTGINTREKIMAMTEYNETQTNKKTQLCK